MSQPPPFSQEPAPDHPGGGASSPAGSGPDSQRIRALTAESFLLRNQNRYAAHPIAKTLRTLRALTGAPSEEGNRGLDFQAAEGVYRAGAQGLPLSQVPQLPQTLAAVSRLRVVDRAGRSHLRRWVEANGVVVDERSFLEKWETQGRLGGAEHHVYHDEGLGRWFKRLYHGVNDSTLGDYFDRLQLHAVLFPETDYRLEGFTINAKSKELAPVVSQPHVDVDTERPPVSKQETDDLMAGLGFAPIHLRYDGVEDDGYHAYLHPQTGVLAHDLHDENVVRLRGTDELAVIDPYISLARRGTWAALKLAEVGLPPPPDDEHSEEAP